MLNKLNFVVALLYYKSLNIATYYSYYYLYILLFSYIFNVCNIFQYDSTSKTDVNEICSVLSSISQFLIDKSIILHWTYTKTH